MEYEKLYAQMVEAAEQAIAAIERADYGQAKQILISAEQRCEAEYLEMEETPKARVTGRMHWLYGNFRRIRMHRTPSPPGLCGKTAYSPRMALRSSPRRYLRMGVDRTARITRQRTRSMST